MIVENMRLHGNEVSEEIIEKMFKAMDLDGNNEISFSEFSRMAVAVALLTNHFE